MADETAPTQRFTSRVADYVAARPGYPPQVLALLAERCGLTPQSAVADVGSGTGILTRVLLDSGCRVFAVEPNVAMRQAAEEALGGRANFVSVDGRAEATTLAGRSVELVTAGQAFHWFEPRAARSEFARILRPGGRVALVWNERRAEGTPFLADYEGLLQTFGADYATTNHRRINAGDIQVFFGEAPVGRAVFPSAQPLDLGGLRSRLASSSYTPAPGQPGHQPMMEALEAIFARYQAGGLVQIEYDTTVYYGQLG
jgi:SAM-dependent methyltransferase